MPVIFTHLRAILLRRDHGFDASSRDGLNQSGRVVTFIGNQGSRLEAFNQRRRQRAVMALTRGQKQAQRIAQGVDGDMNLGGEPAATSP